MVHWLGLGLLLFAGVYGWRMLGYAGGWTRLLGQPPAEVLDPLPYVSVVIAARNEAEHIEPCLHSIAENDYPAGRFEILVVDDCSEDDTAERVTLFGARLLDLPVARPAVRLLRARDNDARRAAHKKAAIELGVRSAQGEVVLFTDADTIVPPMWIRTMVAHFDGASDLVAGPVVYSPVASRFDALQAMEFAGWVAIGAGSIGAGSPELCNGANLAVRRQAYEEVGGLDARAGVTSGDDISLMHAIEARNPGSVRFCPSREALVRTSPSPSVSAFVEQRARWASKATSTPRRSVIAFNFAMVLFDTLLLLATLLVVLAPALVPYVLLAWAIKAWSTHRLIAPFCRHLDLPFSWRYFWGALVLQPVYLLVVGVIGLLRGYEWKGRRIRR